MKKNLIIFFYLIILIDNIIKKLKDSNRYFWFIFKDEKFSSYLYNQKKNICN